MKIVRWYARGGDIAKTGPFRSQARAWEAMRYTDALREQTRYDHPPDTAVWPVEEYAK